MRLELSSWELQQRNYMCILSNGDVFIFYRIDIVYVLSIRDLQSKSGINIIGRVSAVWVGIIFRYYWGYLV